VLLSGARVVPGLKPGTGSTGAATVGIPPVTPAGTYYLLACADDSRMVKEGTETNNCLASATRVTIAP
jgi:hypothetical protein